MVEQKKLGSWSNELIIQHFILGLILLAQSIIKVLNIIIPNRKTKKSFQINTKGDAKLEKPESISTERVLLSEKTSEELRQILKDVDFLSDLNKSQLMGLALINPTALELMKIEDKRKTLQKMTTIEIRSMLKGVGGISRLNKSQLVEIALKQDSKNK